MNPSNPNQVIGVFICHCGKNIATTVDVDEVTRAIAKLDRIVLAENYRYMCSEPGQNMIRDAIREKNLTGLQDKHDV